MTGYVASSAVRRLGKLVEYVLTLCCLCCVFATMPVKGQQPFLTTAGDLKSVAWWVLAEFHPFTTEVRGIPVNKIRKNWCKATEFRKELIPRELLFEGGTDAMAASGFEFALEGHFGGSPTKQVALVGVYEECSGKKGRFILILDQPTGGSVKVRFVSAVLTEHQFGALQRGEHNSIIAWACMECDNFAELKWDSRKRRFDWVPEPADQ